VTTVGLLLLLPLSTPALPLAPGTHVPLRLQHTVTTRTARAGDPVHLRTVHTILADGKPVPGGAYVLGVVLRCDRPGRVRGRAALEIGVASITHPDGTVQPLTGRSPVMEPPERLPPPPFARDPPPVVPVMAGMAAMYGAAGLVSALGSDSEDAVYGSGVAAGLATGVLVGVLKRGAEVVLPAGSLVDVLFQTGQ
jgi:hypothetical protein